LSDFNKHYIYKLLANLIRVPVTFALQAIFPRLLGAAAYGNFDFLTDSTTKFIAFFETGTSVAFYKNLSQNNNNKKLIKFYWLIASVILLAYFLFIMLGRLLGYDELFWPGQHFILVVLTAFFGSLTFIVNNSFQILDASNLTVKSERFRIIQLLFSLSVFATIFWLFKRVDLELFLSIQIVLTVMLIIGASIILWNAQFELFPNVKLSKQELRVFLSLFWKFSNPLIIYALFSLIGGIGDRLILQEFGGSIQQAYFGISFKVGSFVLLFTSAMIPLLMREFSKLHGLDDKLQISEMFQRNIKLLYFIATFIGINVAFNAEFITKLLGGYQFREAVVVVSLMAFYPIHQTLGQINGILFFSTSRTAQYRNIGLFIVPIGLMFSFFLIAPEQYFGLHLGAIGLAYQMLIIQTLSVNLMLFFNCRYLGIPYFKLLAYQVFTLSGQIVLGLALHFLITSLEINLFAYAIVFSFSTLIVITVAVILMPHLIGLNSREELLLKIKYRA
jgi:O-antigen/teichoic acid export membrane protein